MGRGVIVGKFLPPHHGHRLLIETSLAEALARRLETVWVPEYGREHTESKYARGATMPGSTCSEIAVAATSIS